MSFLNFLTGSLGYTAIMAAFGLAVAAHFFAPRAWSAIAWTLAFGVLGAARGREPALCVGGCVMNENTAMVPFLWANKVDGSGMPGIGIQPEIRAVYGAAGRSVLV